MKHAENILIIGLILTNAYVIYKLNEVNTTIKPVAEKVEAIIKAVQID